jgi:hypothetical protein
MEGSEKKKRLDTIKQIRQIKCRYFPVRTVIVPNVECLARTPQNDQSLTMARIYI